MRTIRMVGNASFSTRIWLSSAGDESFQRSARCCCSVLRDYAYIEATGLGVPRKIVRGMHEHNGTEPDLLEEEDRVIVRLWK